jgi:hypothetical protein
MAATPTSLNQSAFTNNSGHTTQTVGITVTTETYLSITVMWQHFATCPAISGVTVNGLPAVAVAGTDGGSISRGSNNRDQSWEFLTPSAGTYNVVVTFASTTSDSLVNVRGFTSVNVLAASAGGFNPGLITASGSAKTIDPSVAPAVGDYLIGCYVNSGSGLGDVSTSDTQIDERYDTNNGSIFNISEKAVSSTSDVLTWTDTGSFDGAGHVYIIKAAPPLFTVQPTDQTVATGGTVVFSATVSDASSYQWETIAPSGSGGWGNVSGGSGGTTDSYTTPTLTRGSDNGRQYRLKATNSIGDTYSNVVEARVTQIPTSYSGIGLVIGASDSFIGEAMIGGDVSVGGVTDYDINAETGTYSLSGVNATFDTAINAAPDSYTLTGIATNFDIAINAALATYSVTGLDAAIVGDLLIDAQPTSYTLTGISATFDIGINAATGSYAVTGSDASLAGDYVINSETGTYALTGVNATSDIGLNANTGAYNVTGIDAVIVGDLLLSVDAGSYSVTGFDASLLTDYSLNAESATYIINGFEANFDALGNYELNAELGTYTVTGSSANFDIGLEANLGGYSLTGFDVSLLADYAINAETGAIVYTGANTGFDISISADTVVYSLVGFDAGFIADYVMDAEIGAYSINGVDVTFLFSGAAPILSARTAYQNLQTISRINLSTSNRKANISTSKRR